LVFCPLSQLHSAGGRGVYRTDANYPKRDAWLTAPTGVEDEREGRG